MRESLINKVKDTIIFKFSLNNEKKSIITTLQDDCYESLNNETLINIIYNSIIDYAFNEFDISIDKINTLHIRALKSKIRFSENDDENRKISYGFYGEVLFNVILKIYYGTDSLISKGYFYNVLDNSETKGYDSYHLIEKNNSLELWFGEVKFRQQISSSIEDILKGFNKVFTTKYFNDNIIAIINRKENLNYESKIISSIINAWENNPEICIAAELNKYNIKFVYPIFIAFDDCKSKNYEKRIAKAINKINNILNIKINELTFKVDIFFILLPLDDIKSIKQEVLKCIESQKPLIY